MANKQTNKSAETNAEIVEENKSVAEKTEPVKAKATAPAKTKSTTTSAKAKATTPAKAKTATAPKKTEKDSTVPAKTVKAKKPETVKATSVPAEAEVSIAPEEVKEVDTAVETVVVASEALKEETAVAEDKPEQKAEGNGQTEGEFANFDDASEREKEQKARDEQIEKDKALPPDPDALLEVRHLKKYFTLKKTITGKPLSVLKAVDDVSFKIYPGETLGIVGESGCGKTTMGRTILKLHQPTSGQVFFEGTDIAGYKSKGMRPLRTKMQIVFQDPYSSLPPRSTVGGILAEAVKVHNIVPKEQVKDYILDVMEKCGLRDYYYERYPHEFSGGQRQRICIARALVLNPKLVVCDEPVSALDVSIQAQIINLLKKLQQERGLTYLFISHDLSVVRFISDKIGVMYLGSMVEFGDKNKIFANPMHPYTVALFSAVPNPNPDEKVERIILKGDIPSPANPPMGCKFHTRCPRAMEICKHIAPVYKEYEEGHFVACHCYPQ